MHTAASLPARGGAKRRTTGKFFDKKTSCENGGSKLGFFESKISVRETSPLDSGICDSGVLGSPGNVKPDCSTGKKKANRGLGFRSTRGSSEGEGDDGLGVSKGTPRRRKDFGKKNCNTDGNPGRNLLMGNVTILKRGEKIEDVVVNKSSDEEESRIGGFRGQLGSEMGSVRGVFVREENKGLEQCSTKVKGLPGKKPIKKAKAVVARVSQVCPVISFSEMNSKDVEIDKGGNGEKCEYLNRLGPDVNVFSKVGSGNLRSVSLGNRNRVSDASSDDDVVDESETSKMSFGSDSNVKSPGTPLAIPRVKTSGQTPEPIEYSNGGFMFEKWAGPAYANSPSPRCLPLPKFFIRHKVRPNTPEEAIIDIKRSEIAESPIQNNDIQPALAVERSNVSMFSHGGFDVFATRNLRRLLQLE